MAQEEIARAVEDVPPLRALFVTAMPDCLLFDSWMRESSDWNAEDVASYFGDLVRANREGLKALGSWSAEMQVTIESADSLIILRELESDYVVAFLFDRNAPLGMVRLHVKRILERVKELLPAVQLEERPEGVRVVEFLQRYAPDPHASLLRVALQTGIRLDDLRRPEALSADQVEAVKRSTQEILGLAELHI